MFVQLLSAATAANNAPSGATAGVPLRGKLCKAAADYGAIATAKEDNQCMIGIQGTSDAAQTLVGTFYLWGYVEDIGKWFRFKLLNGGALAETSADAINYAELVEGIRHYDRLYLELVSPGGTGASFNAYLFLRASPPSGN